MASKVQQTRAQRYIHDVGNLTPTKHNSYYLNKPFRDKKGAVDAEVEHCYAKSPLYEERQLTEWQAWDMTSIHERRAKLLQWTKQRWSVDLSDLEDEERRVESVEDELDRDSDLLVDNGDDRA